MTARERILLLVFGAAVLVVVGGGGFFLVFLKPMNALQARMDMANKDIEKKTAELQDEKKKLEPMLALDPRMEHWRQYSLTDIPARSSYNQIERHKKDVRVEYERELAVFLTKECGLSNPQIKLRETDSRNGIPLLANKVPAYQRIQFNVSVKAAKYESVVKMLEGFYRQERLQCIHDITIKKPTTRGGGFTGLPAGPPAPGNGPPGGGQPAPPFGGGRGFGGRGGGGGGDRTTLELTMTVEVLQVTGAETPDERKARLEKAKKDKKSGRDRKTEEAAAPKDAKPASVLAAGRTYADLLSKNIFFGPATRTAKITESERDVLRAVKLVMLEKLDGGGWRVELWNQGTNEYYRLKSASSVMNGFKVKDRYKNEVLDAKVVDANCEGIVIEMKGKFYRMRLGEFLEEALFPSRDDHDSLHKPLTKYKPGDWKGVGGSAVSVPTSKTESETKDKNE